MINTLFTGKHLIHLPETASTNSYAGNYLANSSPIDGTVILTDSQTAGRGQKGNSWYSEPCNSLTFSIIYRTDFLPATRQFDLNIAVSLAVVEALQSFGPAKNWSIKWPNDILAEQKKVAGILIENTIQGSHLLYSIIGIGINVNQVSFPAELPKAGSLSMAAGHNFDLHHVLGVVLGKIEARFLQMKSGGIATMREKYQKLLFGRGEELAFRDNEGVFKGRISGVNEPGQLLVLKGEQLVAYDMKQIEWLHI